MVCRRPIPWFMTGTGKEKCKKSKHCAASEAHHVDTILSLLWNHTVQQMLTSRSADCTVKLWDLSQYMKEGALCSFGKLHKDKVQAMQWNPMEPAMLLSRSYDCMVPVFNSQFMCVFGPVSLWWGYWFCWGLRCATHTRNLALPQLLPTWVSLPMTISMYPMVQRAKNSHSLSPCLFLSPLSSICSKALDCLSSCTSYQ